MTDYHERIRQRMEPAQGQPDQPRQAFETGLKGMVEADLLKRIIRDTFPGATIGGIEDEEVLDIPILRVITQEQSIFEAEIEELLGNLGEERVTGGTWSVKARQLDGFEDTPADDVRQRITVTADGAEREMVRFEEDVTEAIRSSITGRFAFDEDDFTDFDFDPLANRMEITLTKNSVGNLDVLNAKKPMQGPGIGTVVANKNDDLFDSLDEQIEFIDEFEDREVTSVEMEIL